MLRPNDFYRAAVYLLGRYGDDAWPRASSRAAELRSAGDQIFAIWDVLAATIQEVEKHHDRAPAVSLDPTP